MRLYYEEEVVQNMAYFRSRLNQGISLNILLYKFKDMKDIVDVTIEFEKNAKENKYFKCVGYSPSNS